MSELTLNTNGQSRVCDKRRNWKAIIAASVIGGVVAVVAAPTIAALFPLGWLGFAAGTTTTGILGSVVTKVTGNYWDADKMTATIHLYPTQQFYRKTVIQYIGSALDNVVCCLRANTAFTSHNRVFFDIHDGFNFQGLDAKEQRRMFFKFSFRVIPPPGTRSRSPDEGIPARDLTSYDRQDTRTLTMGDNKNLLNGIGQAVKEGACFGILGGVCGKIAPVLTRSAFIHTVPDKIGVIVGMSTATGIAGPAKNLMSPSMEPDHAALFIEFVTEVQCHVNRLVQCAVENNVGLELEMEIGSTTNMTANAHMSSTLGSQDCAFFWGVKETVNPTPGG
ncbi:hypothetical protein G7Z17_g4668 [Cylindrodendrum hubeiense]|uniref:Uncharacterized protein n=1 Tax=Cylindrodendrum hubeiense TaxID=595255 RepID=A0A9P5H8F2_9HYPO|nr:hypothetical protein G7Z17_g4668 [Cylindrodendrum hubeiense]